MVHYDFIHGKRNQLTEIWFM